MKKRSMKSVEIKKVNVEKLQEWSRGHRVVVSNDVAKRWQYSAFCDEEGTPNLMVRWRLPEDLSLFVEVLRSLPAAAVEVVMEPSGTYGDPIRWALSEAGIAVFRVSPKRVYDSREVYDGLPSLHDKKSALLIANLHTDRRNREKDSLSRPWAWKSETERDLKAMVAMMDAARQERDEHLRRLEGLLARHWPEVTGLLELTSVTLATLLSEIGGPSSVRSKESESSTLMRRVGRTFMTPERIEKILESARRTVGVPMTQWEETWVRESAALALSARRRQEEASRRIREVTRNDESVSSMGSVVGATTAAVIVSELGDVRGYESAKKLEKAAGLSMKEKSSGNHQGPRKITKRGSSRVRRWLFFGALRLIKDDAVTRAWYVRKVQRDGGVKMKAVTAVMRKLLRALWYVARGEAFDSRKLFDVRRLGLAV